MRLLGRLVCWLLNDHTWAVADQFDEEVHYRAWWFCDRCGIYATLWQQDQMEQGRFWR